MFSMRGASGEPYEHSAQLDSVLCRSRLLLVSGYMLSDASQGKFVLELMRKAKNAGVTVALDPCPTIPVVAKETVLEASALCDVLLSNEREQNYIDSLSDGESPTSSVGFVVTKMGERGSRLRCSQGCFSAPARKVAAIDTTGAGDAFNAGFLASFVSCAQPQAWLESGNAAAA